MQKGKGGGTVSRMTECPGRPKARVPNREEKDCWILDRENRHEARDPLGRRTEDRAGERSKSFEKRKKC